MVIVIANLVQRKGTVCIREFAFWPFVYKDKVVDDDGILLTHFTKLIEEIFCNYTVDFFEVLHTGSLPTWYMAN